jgi:hypothetical protein
MAGGFNANTRRKILPITSAITRPTGGGTFGPLTLPKTGLLARVYLALRGTVAGTLTAPNALGMASIISRVRLQVNSGIDIFNVSGAGYHYLLRNALESEYVDPTGQSNATAAVTATTFNLDMVIPVAVNMRDTTGLIMLQNEQTIVNLFIDWLADGSVATGATVSLTTGDVFLEVFTVPPDPQDWPDLNIVHQCLEDQQAIGAAGDFTYNWPRGNTYLQVLHGAGIGASGTDTFNKYALRVNQSDYLQSTPVDYLDMEYRLQRGRARPAGGIFVDLAASSGLGLYAGVSRDAFNSALVTDLASVVTATGAVTLYTVRRQLVVLT